jgi:hypothetical protein
MGMGMGALSGANLALAGLGGMASAGNAPAVTPTCVLCMSNMVSRDELLDEQEFTEITEDIDEEVLIL